MADTNLNTKGLTESQKKLEDAFKTSQESKTTAATETARLNKASQEAYKQTKLENEQTQNQFAQNTTANQLSALDAIRRSNASAIANGANAGLSAANQLSAILGLQQETAEEATNVANASIDAAAQLNTQLNENAVRGAQTANELNAALGANEAELAKAIASNSAALADLRSSELAAEIQQQQLSAENAQANKEELMKLMNDQLVSKMFNAFKAGDKEAFQKYATANQQLQQLISRARIASTQEQLDAIYKEYNDLINLK